MADIYVARQPILDRDFDVYGYELRFRGRRPDTGTPATGAAETDTDTADATDTDTAASQVIISTFLDLGLDSLVGNRRAFINLTDRLLRGHAPLPFAPARMVLEVPHRVLGSVELVDGVRRLSDSGYAVALDDFRWHERAEELLKLAAIVKIDVSGMSEAQLRETVADCRRYDVRLLARRVDSRADFDACRALGFDLFQGHLLSRPELVSGRGLQPSQLTCLRLAAALSSPDISAAQIEPFVVGDPALAYRVLRAANSAASGVSRRLSSVRQALVLLGLRTLRSWVLLMSLDATGQANEEQLTTALARARMCELLAEETRLAGSDTAFTVGLLSSLDLLLGAPLPDLLAQVPLADEVSAAVLRREGHLGQLLASALAYERGEDPPATDGLDEVSLRRSYLAAFAWSLQTCSQALSR